jgi:hypothetical protein
MRAIPPLPVPFTPIDSEVPEEVCGFEFMQEDALITCALPKGHPPLQYESQPLGPSPMPVHEGRES